MTNALSYNINIYTITMNVVLSTSILVLTSISSDRLEVSVTSGENFSNSSGGLLFTNLFDQLKRGEVSLASMGLLSNLYRSNSFRLDTL